MKPLVAATCVLVLTAGLIGCDNQAERDTDRTTAETTRTQKAPEQTPPDEPEAEPGATGEADREEDAQVRIQVEEKEPFGKYLTDAEGMSLYMFEADTRGQESSCYDACAEAWPPLTVENEDQLSAGQGADEALVDAIERRDGTMHVTYGGWPLYYFARDQQPGDTTGQDVEGFGAEWYLVSPAAQVIHEEQQTAR